VRRTKIPIAIDMQVLSPEVNVGTRLSETEYHFLVLKGKVESYSSGNLVIICLEFVIKENKSHYIKIEN